ncbi:MULTISPECIES: DUF6326 family protein [Stenotrophomonas]|jgi:hypothetical protein|uniref:DUF6326 family protein n=1 Tax=Stenotrophomonas TaxID=40323 RepID=UPI00070308B5|nr:MULTISPECIES: DUF6326 family protein [Stenotrophomonas]KRG85396.1 hypothetical protein ABB33_07615 [Stenotrophomonas acidaminiphila]QOF97150.1 hypothetical protein H7691_10865 [Stenotrophomonas sp. CW117]
MQTRSSRTVLSDPPLPLRLKLSALWASLTFCYLYGDYFGLYRPGKLKYMLDGGGPMGPSSQGSLLFVALLLVVPGLMVFLSLALPARLTRWLGIGLALFYAAFVALTMPGAWWFYLAYSSIEIVLCLLIVGLSWRWPRA